MKNCLWVCTFYNSSSVVHRSTYKMCDGSSGMEKFLSSAWEGKCPIKAQKYEKTLSFYVPSILRTSIGDGRFHFRAEMMDGGKTVGCQEFDAAMRETGKAHSFAGDNPAGEIATMSGHISVNISQIKTRYSDEMIDGVVRSTRRSMEKHAIKLHQMTSLISAPNLVRDFANTCCYTPCRPYRFIDIC
ncbi:hypothetical protein HPB51_023976 [Rhipicephalus microplus]|uniref:Uncharacterized protein n=1 Tax=Rhipicephalus microplus TaxID=6941 RepID=A0A9J6ED93_RHIMP|nr:hypothetical protein HPB51_023976 [Rhipicephalus microplus]